MTGFLNQASNPLSAVSIASMADIGYTVDPSAADPYLVSGPPPGAARSVMLRLCNDILRSPVRLLHRRAKIAAPYRP